MQYNLTKRFAKISLATLLLSMGHSFCANVAFSSSTTITPHNSSTHAASVTTTTSVATPKTPATPACASISTANNHLNLALTALLPLKSQSLESAQVQNIESEINLISTQVNETLAKLIGLMNCSR